MARAHQPPTVQLVSTIGEGRHCPSVRVRMHAIRILNRPRMVIAVPPFGDFAIHDAKDVNSADNDGTIRCDCCWYCALPTEQIPSGNLICFCQHLFNRKVIRHQIGATENHRLFCRFNTRRRPLHAGMVNGAVRRKKRIGSRRILSVSYMFIEAVNRSFGAVRRFMIGIRCAVSNEGRIRTTA